jgi:hypothetical protein
MCEERGGNSADYVAYRYGSVGLQTVVRSERSLEVPDPERLLCGTDEVVGFRRRRPRRQVRVVTQAVVGPGADDVARNPDDNRPTPLERWFDASTAERSVQFAFDRPQALSEGSDDEVGHNLAVFRYSLRGKLLVLGEHAPP